MSHNILIEGRGRKAGNDYPTGNYFLMHHQTILIGLVRPGVMNRQKLISKLVIKNLKLYKYKFRKIF